MVDSNLRVLRERIEQVEMKERVGRCWRRENGWNYAYGYNYNYTYKLKRDTRLSDFFGIVGVSAATFGLTLLSGTLALSLLSMLIHFTHHHI